MCIILFAGEIRIASTAVRETVVVVGVFHMFQLKLKYRRSMQQHQIDLRSSGT